VDVLVRNTGLKPVNLFGLGSVSGYYDITSPTTIPTGTLVSLPISRADLIGLTVGIHWTAGRIYYQADVRCNGIQER